MKNSIYTATCVRNVRKPIVKCVAVRAISNVRVISNESEANVRVELTEEQKKNIVKALYSSTSFWDEDSKEVMKNVEEVMIKTEAKKKSLGTYLVE